MMHVYVYACALVYTDVCSKMLIKLLIHKLLNTFTLARLQIFLVVNNRWRQVALK